LPDESDGDRLDEIFKFYIQFIEKSLAAGYPAIRVTSESLYSMLGCGNLISLVNVNSKMNSSLFPHYPCIALCQYDRLKTDPDLLKYAIISHPIILMSDGIYSNVSCINDESFLQISHDRWEAEHWLSVIKREHEAREKLKQSEAQYRLIAENAYDLTIIMDRHNFKYKYVSPSHERVVGYTVEELQGQYCFEHVHPDDRARVEELLRAGIEKGSGTANYRSLTKDGRYIWLQAIGKVIYDEDYQGDILLVTRDITELMLSEMALQKSEEKYRLITDTVQDMIVLIAIQSFVCTYISPATTKILGFGEEELINRVFLDFIHPEDRDLILTAIMKTVSRGGCQIQYRLLKKDGSYIWAESIGKLFDNPNREKELLVTTRDISDRKRVMEALIASEARLRRSEMELKKQLDYISYLIDNMNEIFITYDNQRIINFVNSKGHKSLESIIGQDILVLIPDSHKAMVENQINRRLQKGEAGIFETLVTYGNGMEALVRVKSAPIINNGVVQGAMLLAENISEHRKMEREIARLDRLNTIGEMAAGIGHEIRNPMTAVKGFLQIMNQNDFISYRPYFSIMLEELERANSIVTEFLSLARNKLVDLRLHNLNEIIRAIFPLMQADALLADKSISLDLNEIPELYLDEKEIRQLLINLVRNGLEAMQNGGTVKIATFREGEEAILQVEDEGTGIPAEIMERLGTPFLTTKDNGTGLGLAICLSIAARHEAAIQPLSGPSGTKMLVRFKLPVMLIK
jgi:PAS domain S-box-containing protein